MNIRTFIAIEIDKDIKDKLSEFINKIKKTDADVKWVAPENIHLTLKFIGYIEENVIPDLNKIIKDAIFNLSSFDIDIENVGAFPNLKKPRVVFVCVQDKGDTLLKIYEKLNRGVEKLGIKPDSKKFAGHITLGRIKSQKNLSRLANALNSDTECFFGREKVNHISLMQSNLTPGGPIYERLNTFKLD